MSHFYAKSWSRVQSIASRCGDKSTGLVTQAASHAGAIEVILTHDKVSDKDHYIIRQIQWRHNGILREIASGVLGE